MDFRFVPEAARAEVLRPTRWQLIPFLYEDAPVELTRNRAVGAIHELSLPE